MPKIVKGKFDLLFLFLRVILSEKSFNLYVLYLPLLNLKLHELRKKSDRKKYINMIKSLSIEKTHE